jgi:hypothetical protein
MGIKKDRPQIAEVSPIHLGDRGRSDGTVLHMHPRGQPPRSENSAFRHPASDFPTPSPYLANRPHSMFFPHLPIQKQLTENRQFTSQSGTETALSGVSTAAHFDAHESPMRLRLPDPAQVGLLSYTPTAVPDRLRNTARSEEAARLLDRAVRFYPVGESTKAERG